jgi:hypothetical protein
MPKVLRIDGYRFFFYSDERQEPPHVHVEKGDAVAKVWLQPVRLASAAGFNPGELKRTRELAFEYQVEFVERWNAHFDN